MRAPLVLAALLAPLLTGCLGGAEPAAEAEPLAVAESADLAGAVEGEAPSAPKSAFRVTAAEGEAGENKQDAIAHPLRLRTNAARAPVTLDLGGVFNATDCMGIGMQPVAMNSRRFDLAPYLKVGDVFAYDIQLEYETTQSNWAEIHLLYGIGNKIVGHTEPNGEKRGPIVQNYTGQSYRVAKDDFAWVNVNCWYGQTTQPVPFKLTVKLTFAEDAIPAESPVLVTIPQGATKLFVRGVALDPSQGVNSHYRIFGPDDELLCECGLGAFDEASYFSVPAPGDYVLLVDHTSNGFVSLALDVPPEIDLKPLASEFVVHKVMTLSGEAVDKTVDLDLPQVPLLMHAFTTAGGDQTSAGAGKKVELEVTNVRGTPLAIKWGGYFAHQVRSPVANWNQWWGIWPEAAAWGYAADHHAYGPGVHQVRVKAEALKGDVMIVTRQYVR